MKNKRPNKLEVAIQILSVLQFALYSWAIYLSVIANHQEVLNTSEALAPMFPAILFVIGGSINLFLCVILFVRSVKQKSWPRVLTLCLVVLVILLTAFVVPISQFVDKL